MQFPNSYESERDTFNRAQVFKSFLRYHLESNPLVDGEKIAVVTHSWFIRALTAQKVVWQNGDWYFEDYIHPENCEIIAWAGYKQKKITKKRID